MTSFQFVKSKLSGVGTMVRASSGMLRGYMSSLYTYARVVFSFPSCHMFSMKGLIAKEGTILTHFCLKYRRPESAAAIEEEARIVVCR